MNQTSLSLVLRSVAQALQGLASSGVWSLNAAEAAVQFTGDAVLRQLACARELRILLAPKKPAPAADALLTAALALLCAQRTAQNNTGAAYADHVIVSQAVEAAKHDAKLKAFAPFINACLRRFLREEHALMQRALSSIEAEFNHPAWWIERLQRDWPEHWQALLRYNTTQAPLTLRIFEKNSSAAAMKSALNAIFSIATEELQELADSGLQVRRNLPVAQLPGYAQGWFSVQDAAAQAAAPLLLDALLRHTRSEQPWRILDACAAPGGKTTHLLEYALKKRCDVQVTALDVDQERSQRIEENLRRLGLTATVRVADAAQPQTWHDGQPWHGILLDAPCTASGIVRRHPDIVWQRRQADVAALAAQQKRLLQALWKLLAPGGVLLYCTCSVFKAEGQDQIEAFVAHNTDAQSLPAPGHLLPVLARSECPMPENPWGEHDGFFYALLRKLA